METLSQIEQYITGEMTEAERSAFEKAMQQDAELQQEVAAYRDIIAGIEQAETDAFQHMLQGWEAQSKKQGQPQQAKVKRLFSPQLSMALAAAVVLLLTFIFIFKPFSSAVDPFQQAFTPYPDEITVMGGPSTELDQQQANEAMALYNEGKYAEALPLLKNLVSQRPDIAVLRLYQGIAELQAEDYAAAQASFTALRETSYKEAGEWYQALTQVKMGNLDIAKNLLNSMAASDLHPYHDQAKGLLEEL